MDTTRIPPAGDPFTAKQHETTEEKRLAALEQRLSHELLDHEERQELRDQVLALRRRLSRYAGVKYP
jgi:hypothetical protein